MCEPRRATPQGLAAIKIGSTRETTARRVPPTQPVSRLSHLVPRGVQASRHPACQGEGENKGEERHDAGASALSDSRPGRPSGLGDGDNGSGNDSARGKSDKQPQRASKRGPWPLAAVAAATAGVGQDGDGAGTKVQTASVPPLERFNPTTCRGPHCFRLQASSGLLLPFARHDDGAKF